MQMESITQEIFNLVKKKMEEQGAYTRDAYKEVVEEAIEYFRQKGKITDEDPEEFIEDKLMDMFEEAKNAVVS